MNKFLRSMPLVMGLISLTALPGNALDPAANRSQTREALAFLITPEAQSPFERLEKLWSEGTAPANLEETKGWRAGRAFRANARFQPLGTLLTGDDVEGGSGGPIFDRYLLTVRLASNASQYDDMDAEAKQAIRDEIHRFDANKRWSDPVLGQAQVDFVYDYDDGDKNHYELRKNGTYLVVKITDYQSTITYAYYYKTVTP